MATYLVWKNNVVTMVRGDTAQIEIPIYLLWRSLGVNPWDEHKYLPENDDTVYFGLMKANEPFEKSILIKTYHASPDSETEDDIDFIESSDEEESKFVIHISPEDTIYLLPGDYYYCVKYNKLKKVEDTYETDEVYTIIPRTKFMIVE